MKNRRIYSKEQPEVLTDQLGRATVIDDNGLPVEGAPTGVPHGVTHAIVTMERVRVEGDLIFFCESCNYRVAAMSLHGADNGPQPPTEASKISTSRPNLPTSGYYNVRSRVGLNGSRKVHIETFEPVLV